MPSLPKQTFIPRGVSRRRIFQDVFALLRVLKFMKKISYSIVLCLFKIFEYTTSYATNLILTCEIYHFLQTE